MSRLGGAGHDDIAALFVKRPVFAVVLSLLIVVAGLAALGGVEVRELPNVDRSIVTANTNYDGASPETVDQEITAVIESAVGRVSGLLSVSSTSSLGRSRVVAEFSDSVDIDTAAQDMRDAIASVERDLPESADDTSVVKSDDDSEPVMRMAITSETLSAEEITELAEDSIVDRFIAVDGVADIQLYGDREQVFRVDVDTLALAARNLSIADLEAALDDAAFDAPAGNLSNDTGELTVRATAQVATSAGIADLYIDETTRVRDVANVTLGPDIGSSSLRVNGKNGVGMGVLRQSGSNTLDISKNIRAVVAELNPTLPGDLEVRVTSDDAVFVSSSIEEVVKSLLLATTIVIGIIYLFLLNVRATLIPAITMPVALIGTLAGIWLAGFSVNILTLLALVLATGMVVDDAIVVLENIVNQRKAGLKPRAAAVIGTRQVFFAVITTTAVLAAVFIPLSFLPGTAGGLFREFGFVLAIAVTISSIVALTLCPMLASRLLTDEPDEAAASRKPRLLARIGARAAAAYARVLRACLAVPALIIAVSIAFGAIAWGSYNKLPAELVPSEDRAVSLLSLTAPQGVSLEYTGEQLMRIEQLVQPYVDSGEIENVFAIAGRRGQSNSGFMVMTLAKWADRERSQGEIVAEINRALGGVTGVRARVIQPNSLGIRGAGSGLSVAITGDNYDELAVAGDALAAKLEQDPRFGRVTFNYETDQPQLSIDIDRDRAADLGIPIAGLTTALQAVLEGADAGEVFVGDRAVTVKVVATSEPVNDPGDLANLVISASDGTVVPLSSIASIRESAIAPSLPREQRSRAVTLSASLTDDLPLRQGLEELTELAQPLLPEGAQLVPLAEAATLNQTSSGVGLVFAFAMIIVFLVLAAQFESFISASIIMVTVPMGLACAVFALAMTGTSLNLYSQIGLVLLVGIMAKNGILIVEFANQLRDEGASVADAAFQAATRRLRPVTMTLCSTVLGGVPLVLASGAGAEAREALGWVIVGGLGLATVFTLLLTPVVYRVLAPLSSPRMADTRRLEAELDAAAS